jgi:plasmid maintenance system antidote protein VapI
MEKVDVQQLFFQKIKESTPAHLSFVDELAEVLNISNDSVYRRIRGEKPISFEEIQKLCSHYKLSLDQFLNLQSDAFTFRGQLKNEEENNFENWLQHIKQNFQLFNSFQSKHMSILMKDIPPFVHFLIPELAMFKFYFWMKSILNHPGLRGVKFDLDDSRYVKYLDQSNQIVELYLSIPTTEIWNIESVNSTIRQINFYHEAGLFPNRKTTLLLYEKVEDLINHIEQQAEAGKKFAFGQSPKPHNAEYRQFVNELILGDNTYLIELNGSKMVFLNHSVIYFAATSDLQFTNSIASNFESLEKKSTMISSSGQKERSVFFNSIRKMIQIRKDLV